MTPSTAAVGGNLNDLKEFIKAQPSRTVIGIGYMSNAGVNVVQNFTADHELAVKAVRLPRGSFSTMDSPYLSLISVAKGWTQQNVRREVLMLSDGIDRLRGQMPSPAQLGARTVGVYHSMLPSVLTRRRPARQVSATTSLFIPCTRSVSDGPAGVPGTSK
jgi:hypothetical protein